MVPNERKKLIIVAGPTAVGKTATAVALARHYETEIISADSRQIYRELSIGTAKPSASDLALITHHFVDTHSISENYDAAQFGIEATVKIDELFKSKNHVILCGGSGLYIKAVVEGFDDIPAIDPEVRRKLINEYHHYGLKWLQNEMAVSDPDHYKNIDNQNPHRLIRALEVKIGTGFSIAHYQKRAQKEHSYSLVKIGLDLPREVLYERINTRMDEMIRQGLFEEAKRFYEFRSHNALQTVGYREIFEFIDGKYDYDEAVRLLKQNTRHYAKRQLTWFKRDAEMKWFRPDQLQEMIVFIEQSNLES